MESITVKLSGAELTQLRRFHEESKELQKEFGSWFSSPETTSKEQRSLAYVLNILFRGDSDVVRP